MKNTLKGFKAWWNNYEESFADEWDEETKQVFLITAMDAYKQGVKEGKRQKINELIQNLRAM